jgi:enterochelin esterase-like enzyme
MRLVWLLALVMPARLGIEPPPTAQALIERQAKEKAPVWVDGDTATFFYRGEADQLSLVLGGETLHLQRLPDSDVWTLRVQRPDLERGLFTYALIPARKGQPAPKPGERVTFHTWRGPKAPPAPDVVRELKGTERTASIESKALGEKRAVRVYLPPGHDKTRPYPVVYATDGRLNADVLEPLITSGKVRPVIVVATSSGGYLGKRDGAGEYDVRKDLRALEYIPRLDPDHFAKHERFFCEEVLAWAERELGASTERQDRAVFGCSNGARFAVEMGLRHPELFGNVFAFSVAGARQFEAPGRRERSPTYYLAAGTWEKAFHKMTADVAEKLKAGQAPVVLTSRVAGHDEAMWRDEFAAAVQQTFAKAERPQRGRTRDRNP